MKLFLSSLSISEEQKTTFAGLVGKPLREISFVLIENAADTYEESSKGFVLETRQNLESLGMNIKVLDITRYTDESETILGELKDADVVWFGGGNVYYLRWLMKKTGLDTVIQKLVREGVVYGGGSAGAIVAGKTLRHYDIVDDPGLAPEVMYDGLDLTDIIMIPHWETEGIQSKLQEIKSLYEEEGSEVVVIKDGQALLIEGDNWRIV